MATKPGILTDWPWKPLGSFKYAIVAPWIVHSIYSFMVKGDKERDLVYFMISISFFMRLLHNQIWISLSRYQTARGYRRIVDKGIEFDQTDRENNWDDQIIMAAIMLYVANIEFPQASKLPIWRTDGIIITVLLHAGPVEFLYYWLHRALHHSYLFTKYHSHHHSSIATQPITSVIHPFAETMAYIMLFAMPLLGVLFSGRSSLVAVFGYLFYIDFMNNLGHCNFEVFPVWLFSIFPPLKYLMYTPSFHSLHHTQFRTNYSLFMPFYDYIYNTVDKSSDKVHEVSLKKRKELPNLVHLTHFTTPNSIYHLRLGISSLASRPLTSIWYLWFFWPFTYLFMLITWLSGYTFIGERNTFKNVKSQTWVIPRYKFQYFLEWQRMDVNNLIEETILEAEDQGIKVLSLGLLNQEEELNGSGKLYIEKYPKLKIKLVDGSSLAAAVVLNSIPKGTTTKLVLRGNLTKVALAIASALCHRNIQVAVLNEDEYRKLGLHNQNATNVVLSTSSYEQKIWLVGDGFSEEDQWKAPKGTLFIPFSQFPPKRIRKDCFYHITPAMLTPPSLQNLDSCEDWLPRRVMSAWRIAGFIHAVEDWKVNECGDTIFNIDQVWKASLHHGFHPLSITITNYLF